MRIWKNSAGIATCLIAAASMAAAQQAPTSPSTKAPTPPVAAQKAATAPPAKKPITRAAAPAKPGECDLDMKVTDGFPELTTKLKCLAGEISALRREVAGLKGGGAIGGASSSASSAKLPTASGIQTQEGGGGRFEIESCKKTGSTISCRIFVTSNGKDQNIRIYSGSRIVDGNGVLYSWRGYQGLGEKQIESGDIRRWFVGDVRTGAQIVFEAQSDQSAVVLSVVQLSVASDSTSNGTQVTFRNVALQ